MGMYDTLNGEQIKFFSVPCIGMPDSTFLNSTLHFMGGKLRDFGKKSKVPYCTLWYNYGKDFNIIDFFPYEHNEQMVHLIRNGKNIGFVYLSNISNDIFKYKSYDDRGNLLNINNKKELEDCLNTKNNYRNAILNIKKDAFREELEYFRNHTAEERETEEVTKIFNELHEKTLKESEENEKMLEPYINEVSKFVVNLEEMYPYENFGGLVEGLYLFGKQLLNKDNLNFVVNDERLIYIVAYNEMLELYKSDKNFINNYYKILDFSDDDIKNFINIFEFITDAYEIIKNLKITKDMFYEKYALRDIENGRYKDFYLKYNVIPYENFDYSIWDKLEE